MIFVGEKLNSSIPSSLSAIEAGGDDALALIRRQADGGADYIDVNTALCADEKAKMLEILALVTANTDCGIMIDSSDAAVAAAAALANRGRKMIINSVTATERLNELSPVAAELGAGVVVMPIDARGVTHSAADRAGVAEAVIEKLRSDGVRDENIYVDAMVEALATGDENPSVTLATVKLLREKFPNIHIICGLSNVSFGLPDRGKINTAFLSMAIYAGLDAAICDAASPNIRTAALAAEALLGRDEYCMNYIENYRNNQQ